MAKRPDDDEDDIPKVRKRRYQPKKADDDDEDAPLPGKRKGGRDEVDEEEDGEGSISTGNAFLDITLDFVDDCIDWSKAHLVYAIIIAAVSFITFSTLSYLFINSWVRYFNRPSLEAVINAYDLGLFPETIYLADYALEYASKSRPGSRSPFLFLQGAAVCALAERASPADKRDFYLMAANYLQESSVYGFLPGRASEGWYLLGKCLYQCRELEQCREPLEHALEDGYPHTKEIYWILANAYFFGASPNLLRAKELLQQFQSEPTALEEEIAESRLLETMITLHTAGIEVLDKDTFQGEALEVFAKVPRFEHYVHKHNFVEGQIELFKARKFRELAVEQENDPNPRLLRHLQDIRQTLPVAPPPMREESFSLPEPDIPVISDLSSAPVVASIEIPPMDDAALREFMLPSPPPAVVGTFDLDSELQLRIAELQAKYAQNVGGVQNVGSNGIVILSPDDKRAAPVPPPLTEEFETVQQEIDPILKQIIELRNKANNHYQRAIIHFAEVVRLAEADDVLGHVSRFLTGICYQEMGDTVTAEEHFRTLIETFPLSSEAISAAFILGEIEREKGNAAASFRAFSSAFEKLRRTANYASLWLPLTEIVERTDVIVREDIENNAHAEAINFLDILHGVMPPTEIARLRGETYETWATLLQTEAESLRLEEGLRLIEEAEAKRRSAGDALVTLAHLRSGELDYSEVLWQAAENYRWGKDFRRAVAEYQRFLSVNFTAHRPEVYLRLGEMYLHLDFLSLAEEVLNEALHNHPAHYLIPEIRLVLSYVYYEQKEWDKAKTLLRLNLIGEAAPQSGPYRDSMFALGEISFVQGDYDSAIAYLEDAVKVHPFAIQVAEAKYNLAQSYLKQAENAVNEMATHPPEAVRRSVEGIAANYRQRAMHYFDQTEKVLMERRQSIGLTESEILMLRNVHFMTCAVLLQMERYDEVIPKLNTVATMYQTRPESVGALVKMAFAQRMLGKDVESRTTLRRAEVILNQLERNGTITEDNDWRNVIQRQMSP